MNSTHLRRQSRVRKSTFSLCSPMESISEDTEDTLETISPRRNSVKARRRQGVSDLRVPPMELFTVDTVTGWRLSLALNEDDEDVDVFDFPEPPLRGNDSSSSESDSGRSSPATTPSPSPVRESHTPQSTLLQRCKTIKPLTITKRSVSPIPPIAPTPPQLQVHAPELDDNEREISFEDDDEDFYASYARGFFTLTSPLPQTLAPSRSDSYTSTLSESTRRHNNRESAVMARPLSALLTPPSTPPVGTHVRSASTPELIPNFSRPTSLAIVAGCSRPPPRRPVPIDAPNPRASTHSVWRDSDFAAYAPLISSSPSSPSASGFATSLSPISPAASPFKLPPTPLSGSLLSPASARSRRSVTAEVPSDIEGGDGDWEDAFDEEADYPDMDVPRTPISDCYDEEEWSFPPSPLPPRLRPEPVFLSTPVSPCSVFTFPSDSQGDSDDDEDEVERLQPDYDDEDEPPSPSPIPATPATPILRSRWSASTLASVRSPTSASPRSAGFLRSPASASGKTFAFARRYLKSSSPSSAEKRDSSPSTSQAAGSSSSVRLGPRRGKSKTKTKTKTKTKKPRPVPMGSVSSPIPSRTTSGGTLVVGRPPAPMSILAAASNGSGSGDASPFAAAWPFSAQWAGNGAGAGRY
ncbi:hypothetical protein C8F01DRAFT_1156824 [Mycena amicta]|nr:hypothetical protein C8F01DRAFT_1156824 [Mycena amicta]